jgi:hypothetical protein
MGTTGWMGAEEPDEVPAMPLTELLLDRQQHRAGPLETALARSAADDRRAAREAEASRHDPDEFAAGLVARGYSPGQISQLCMRLADTEAELAAEEDLLQKAARRAQFAAREHAAGRADVSRMLAMMDGEEGDEGRVAMLERRAGSLRRQIAEAQAMIAPPQRREMDGVEAASRAAHEVFREVTRARLAEAQARAPERRPFAGSVSRGRSTEHVADGPCWVCEQGRERDAARRAGDGGTAPYAPGDVITTGYQQQGIAYR